MPVSVCIAWRVNESVFTSKPENDQAVECGWADDDDPAARRATILHGDCIEAMERMPADSVDAIVTDPPYGLGFMGREWDVFAPGRVAQRKESIRRKDTVRASERWSDRVGEGKAGGGAPIEYDESPKGHRRFQAWCQRWATAALRVAKPGAHLLSFGGTRTHHRLTCGLEDAGWEVRDCLSWLYGSGFPKSHDVARAIDRELFGTVIDGGGQGRDLPRTAEGVAWAGWGTALKPGWEPIVLARKPMSTTIARSVLENGTGGLNIDACRIECEGGSPSVERRGQSTAALDRNRSHSQGVAESTGRLESRTTPERYATQRPGEAIGRWPANVLLTHSLGCSQVGVRRIPRNVVEGIDRVRSPGMGSGVAYSGGLDRSLHGSRQIGVVDEEVGVWDCEEGCPVLELDRQSGVRAPGAFPQTRDPREDEKVYGPGWASGTSGDRVETDLGGASRFYYTSKAARSEREVGLEDLPAQTLNRTTGEGLGSAPRCPVHDASLPSGCVAYSCGCPLVGRREAAEILARTKVAPASGFRCRACRRWKVSGNPCRCDAPDFEEVPFERVAVRNVHPTVKPLDLMRWLVRLVTPPMGLVLDPFLGSGTTAVAALEEGCRVVGVEREAAYVAIARGRAGLPASRPTLPFSGVA